MSNEGSPDNVNSNDMKIIQSAVKYGSVYAAFMRLIALTRHGFKYMEK